MKESTTYQALLEEGRAEGQSVGAVAEARKVLRYENVASRRDRLRVNTYFAPATPSSVRSRSICSAIARGGRGVFGRVAGGRRAG